MMNHMMIDLETLSTKPEAVIISCGVVMFDPVAGKVSKDSSCQRHDVLQIQAQLNMGRIVDAGTLKWWMCQSDEAIRAWNKPERECIRQDAFLSDLTRFWFKNHAEYVWSHGSIFDIAILENMYGLVMHPWRFWNIRDTRTLFHNKDFQIKRDKGVHHNALDDAIAQAEAVCEAWRK